MKFYATPKTITLEIIPVARPALGQQLGVLQSPVIVALVQYIEQAKRVRTLHSTLVPMTVELVHCNTQDQMQCEARTIVSPVPLGDDSREVAVPYIEAQCKHCV